MRNCKRLNNKNTNKKLGQRRRKCQGLKKSKNFKIEINSNENYNC
jgi:hypothetical protein